MIVETSPQTMFQPIKTHRTADSVVDRLEARILDGSFSVGELLPSEEQLAAQFAVGRRSVREALKVLESRGLVETRMGIGTSVRRNDLDNFLDALARNIITYVRIDKADVIHVADLRILLETAALERLAAAQDEDFLARLDEIIANQKISQATDNFHSYQDWHFNFHYEIVDSLDNPVISMLYKQILALMRKPMEQAGSDPAVMARSIRDHERIVDALRQGSTTNLRSILSAHLQDSVANLQNVIGDSTIVDNTS